MDDPNITMEEYIRLEEEKAHRHGKVYNWETATYDRIWYHDDVHDLRYVETEFPAIVFNDKLTSEEALSCETTVSSLDDNKIDFRISFDESDDDDYTVIFDKNSFSYKIIYVDDLKTHSENDNDKVNMSSFPSPEPTVSYFDDLDYFKDFEKVFPAIVYNDALKSKLDSLTEPSVSPQHIDEFNLKDETSLSKCDGEEQKVLYFNDLFPFNVIYPNDLKSDGDNDDKKIDIKQPSGDISIIPSPNEINTDIVAEAKFDFANMALPPRDQRHPYLRFEGLEYTNADIADFEDRLGKIYGREMHWVQGQNGFTSQAWSCRMSWREFILGMGPHTTEEMESAGFGTYWVESVRQILDKRDMSAYWVGILYAGDFHGTSPSYTLIRDLMLRLCHRLIAYNIAGRSQAPEKVIMTEMFYLRGMDFGLVNISYLLARYLRMFTSGKKRRAMLSGAQFICEELDDTWAWVAPRPERQPDAAVGAPKVAESAPDIAEGAQAITAPVQAPQPPLVAVPARSLS
ncbi:hypothetical protein Tco_0748100 [Tanacetum coccineum]|uniref:Uncharacterized protein n=1 Tax=Tanacetum coccineum TaxID=301880 RepID=A0ABQ4YUN4_9ASTR